MATPGTLTDRLRSRREATPAWMPIYDDFVARLRGLRVGARAPRVGEAFPPFALPDHRGRYVALPALLAGGPIVLSFQRGEWCPYCSLEIDLWALALPELAAAGGRFVAVTPEAGGHADRFAARLGAQAVTLCDIDHGLALDAGLAFHMGPDMPRRYRDRGLDLAAIYGGASDLLPVPATFAIDRDGIVRYAFVEPDFRLRAEPAEAIAAIAAISSP